MSSPGSESERLLGAYVRLLQNAVAGVGASDEQARYDVYRRAHDFLTASGLSECPNCHEKKLPHRACPKCGAYKGRAVLDIKEAAK